ncbi:MAG: DUF5462 family protein [Acinetobacter sp.]
MNILSKVTILIISLLTIIFIKNSHSSHKSSETYINLGFINGKVKDNQIIEINRSLPNPILFRTKKNTLNATLYRIVFKDSQARQGDNGRIQLYTHWQKGTINGGVDKFNSMINIALLINDRLFPIQFTESQGQVNIVIPEWAENIEIRAESPFKLQLPRGYKGIISLPFVIEGWSKNI